MSEIICLECGDRNNNAVQFCNSCGAYLEWEDHPGQGQPAPAAPSAATSAAAPNLHHTPSAATYSSPTAAPEPSRVPAPAALQPPISRSTPPARGAAMPVAAPVLVPTGGRSTAARATGSGHQVVPGRANRSVGDLGADQPSIATDESLPARCSRCSTANSPGLRFCCKCGLSLQSEVESPAAVGQPSTLQQTPWWQRGFRRGAADQNIGNGIGRRAARAAYRRSLPLTYRLRRWIFALVVVGLLGGGLVFLGQNPWSWLADRWNDLRGNLVQVAQVQAVVEPAAAEFPDFPASLVVDQLANTAWVSTWTAPIDQTSPANCLPPSATATATDQGTILLLLPASTDIRAIIISAGLAEQDPSRPHQWRPKMLQLTFTDGQCQTLELVDAPGPQQFEIENTTTTAVRVRVLDAYPASGTDGRDLVAISELQVLARPGS